MREIKFRGLSLLDNYWEHGYFTIEGGHNIIRRHDSKPNEAATPIIIKGETRGQYAGIKDRHGIEIYEGDILKLDIYCYADADEPTIFPFNDYSFDLPYITQINQFIEKYGDEPDVHDSIEVIGNIYDNPELIPK